MVIALECEVRCHTHCPYSKRRVRVRDSQHWISPLGNVTGAVSVGRVAEIRSAFTRSIWSAAAEGVRCFIRTTGDAAVASPEGRTANKNARRGFADSSAAREAKAASPAVLIPLRTPSAAALHIDPVPACPIWATRPTDTAPVLGPGYVAHSYRSATTGSIFEALRAGQ